jgi:hypothetical protein
LAEEETKRPLPLLNAKADTWRVTLAPSHCGQAMATSLRNTIFSNSVPQASQTYSKMGMSLSVRLRAGHGGALTRSHMSS